MDEEYYYNFPSATLRGGLSVAGCQPGAFLYMSLLVETGNGDIIINVADSCDVIVLVVGFILLMRKNTLRHDWLT